MQNLILKHFRGCWERIVVLSPTAVLDKSTWDPVRKYIQEDMGVDLKREQAFFTEFDPAVLQAIVTNTQRHRAETEGPKRSQAVRNACDR